MSFQAQPTDAGKICIKEVHVRLQVRLRAYIYTNIHDGPPPNYARAARTSRPVRLEMRSESVSMIVQVMPCLWVAKDRVR